MNKDYAVIFKRTGFVEGKGCSLEPIGYVEGTETIIKGTKYFMIDPSFRMHLLEDVVPEEDLEEFLKANKKAKYMGDRSNFSIKYVYGSPLDLKVLKDLIVYNFSYLDGAFPEMSARALEESYEDSVNTLKSRYVEALKEYNFYQLVSSDGKVNTFIQRKEPRYQEVSMNGIIPEIITEEVGFEIPEGYDFSGDYSSVYKQIPTEIDIKKIYEETKEYIKGQDKHILPVLSAINDNLHAELPEERSNILVCGPTGCGKTAVFKRIADMVGLPIVIEDSTQFTKAGYVGRDISDVFEDLIEAANGDQELAQRGIIIIDEIDKKASGRDDSISGVGVLQSMLKLLEGGDYTYEVGNGMVTQLKTFNTLNTTIAFGGAFSGLSELNTPPKTLGFGREDASPKSGSIYDVENLDKYGIPPEFFGRINLLEVFDKLEVETLKDILLNARINPLDLFVKKMKRYNTEVIITDGYINEVSKEAYRRNTGARGLYTIVKESTKLAQGEIELMNRNISKELTLTPEMVYDNMGYELKTNIKVKTLKR